MVFLRSQAMNSSKPANQVSQSDQMEPNTKPDLFITFTCNPKWKEIWCQDRRPGIDLTSSVEFSRSWTNSWTTSTRRRVRKSKSRRSRDWISETWPTALPLFDHPGRRVQAENFKAGRPSHLGRNSGRTRVPGFVREGDQAHDSHTLQQRVPKVQTKERQPVQPKLSEAVSRTNIVEHRLVPSLPKKNSFELTDVQGCHWWKRAVSETF